MSQEQIGKRQQQILDYLRETIATTGYPPSIREICKAVGLSSTSSVHGHLNILADKGYIIRDNGARCIRLVEQDEPAADGPSKSTTLPLVGSVAAGLPILAEQNIEDEFVLPTAIVGDKSSFLLKVKGDSMIEIGILDGDYVVVQESSIAENGEIVVALVEDSATVKRFFKEDGRIRLQPENSSMDPIFVDDAVILGKVIALFRTL